MRYLPAAPARRCRTASGRGFLRRPRCADSEIAQRQRLAAFEQAPLNPGNLNQADTPAVAFHWLMDGDASGPVCDLSSMGRYCWLPFAAIAEIRFQAPASVTDLGWRHALVRLTDGSEQV